MVLRATTCLRRLGGDRRGERQAGQFFANRKVTAAAIIDSWHQPSVEAVAGRHVLALQDTTALSFATGGDAQSARGGALWTLLARRLAVARERPRMASARVA